MRVATRGGRIWGSERCWSSPLGIATRPVPHVHTRRSGAHLAVPAQSDTHILPYSPPAQASRTTSRFR